MKKSNHKSATDLLAELLTKSHLWSSEACPFRAHVTPANSNVVLLAGENATGKSMLAKSLVAWASHHAKYQPITLTMSERTGSTLHEMGGMRRAMIYGDESQKSTGTNSFNVVKRAMSNYQAWSEQNPTFILLDEPDLGLSESYCFAMGQYIGQEAAKVPSSRGILVVCTHSRNLASGLQEGLGQTPTFVHMAAPKSMSEWMIHKQQQTIADLESLSETAHQRFRAVHAILRELEEEIEPERRARQPSPA